MGRATVALVLVILACALTPGPAPSVLGAGSRAAAQPCPAPSPNDHYPVSPTPTAASGLTEPTPIPALDREATADFTLDAMVQAAANTLQVCWNAGQWAAVEALLTPRFLETAFGIAAPDATMRAEALARLGLGSLEILEVGPVAIWNDGRGVVDIIYRRGQGDTRQAVAARWHVVAARGRIWFDEETTLLPPPLGDRLTAGFSMPDDEQPLAWSSPASSQIATSPVIALHGANRGRLPHTVILEDEGGRAVGLLTLPAGRQVDLVLLDLPPGTYRLYDPAVPGSEATLVVTG